MCELRTFKIYSLSHFQKYNTVLLAIVTMLYITSPEFTHLTAGNLYPLMVLFPYFKVNIIRCKNHVAVEMINKYTYWHIYLFMHFELFS